MDVAGRKGECENIEQLPQQLAADISAATANLY
jgi:hypothetical protein